MKFSKIKEIRFDIMLVLLTPFAFSIIMQSLYGTIHLIVTYALLFIALVCECIFLNEKSSHNTFLGKDRGLLSGFLTSVTLSLLQVVAVNANIQHNSYQRAIISILFIVIGIAFRIIAKVQLKEAFSHSIRIKENHQLITTGIYGYIRHPSYTGTICIITGVAVNISFLVSLIMLCVTTIAILYRIKYEEKMMVEYFGVNYTGYSKRTKKLFPYIF